MANKFVIEVRAKGFEKLNTDLKRADGAMRNYGNGSQRAGKQTNEFRKQIALVRNNLLLYTFALTGASRVLGKFIKLASDGQETLNQFKVVFGEQSDAALNFARTLSVAFDKAEDDVIALMAALQDTFVPLGFSRKEARTLSETLTQLAFDVQSFKNASSAEVSQAFTSAIVGNHEAVRKYGISITEAEVKLAAMRLGIKNASGGLTSQQKVIARTALIINGAGDAIGDYNNTQHEFANQVRALQANFKDLGKEVGEFLLPLAKVMVHFTKVERVKGYALGITAVGLAFAYTKRQAILASLAILKTRTALIKSGYGIAAIVLGELASKFIFAKDGADDFDGELKDLSKSMEELEKLAKGLDAGVDPDKMFGDKQFGEQIKRANELMALEEQMNEARMRHNDNRRVGFLAAESEIEALRKEMEEAEETRIESAQTGFDDMLRGLKAQQDAALKTAGAFKQFSDNIGKAVVEGQALGPAVVNSLKAIAAQMAAEAVSYMILNMITGGAASASSMGFSLLGSVIGHKGGSVTNKGVQTFARGGTVRGRDNVPILAQAGEFIINRDSAQSIGLNNLTQMNESGQAASNINVHIHGGIVQEDYITNELIPAIDKSKALA